MNRMKKLCVLVLALALAVGLVPGGLPAASAEVKNPGLDVVIVIDFSFSTFPGINNNEADPNLMCLDAAAMLINMCDAAYSKVAIVPFTDGQPFIEDYNRSIGNLWNTWIDVSDKSQRKALCDSLFVSEMYKAGNSRIHQGNTNYALGMRQALDLILGSNTGNQKLVLVLGDGRSQPESAENENAAIESAGEIKKADGRIYCLQFGNDENGRRLLRNIATDDATYWSNVQPSELKKRFSDVFAELIGTEQETVFSQPDAQSGAEIFNINIPHRAISEVNVVMDKNKIAGDVVVLDGNNEVVGEGPNLLQYTNDNYSKNPYEAYDFVSLKILDAMPGVWKVKADRANNVPAGEQTTIDLLYNYEVELVAGLSDAEDNAYRKNETVVIESYFVDANGDPSDDETLYAGRQENGSGIEAILTLYDEAGGIILQEPMTADYEGRRFVYPIDLKAASFVNRTTKENQVFQYSVSAEGDHLFRTTETPGAFYIFGDAPTRTTEEPVFLGTIRVDDIFSDSGEPDYLFSEPLSGYFRDEDDEELEYVIAGSSRLDCGIGEREGAKVLGVGSQGNENVNGGYVDIYAMDGAGNSSDPVRFLANVVSIRKLVEDCVTVEAVPLDDARLNEGKLNKGQSATVSVAQRIVPPGADFPYNYLNELVTDEAVEAALTVKNTPLEMPEDAVFEGEEEPAFTVTAGRRTGKIRIDTTAQIKDIEKPVGETAFEVVNISPRVADALGAFLAEAGAQEGEVPTFQVDKDKPEAAKLTFDLGQWFEDGDGAFDSLSYTAAVEALPQTRDIFTPARGILRLINLIPREGDAVAVNADAETGRLEAAELDLAAERFGNARVTVTAADEDGAQVSYTLGYEISSSRERLMCLITYAVILILLVIILIVLINKLVVHRPWPRHNDEYRVILNDFSALSDEGRESRRFHIVGRKACKLKALADHFDIGDGGCSARIFDRIYLWPTTGNRLVVEIARRDHLERDALVKVDGVDITRGRKAKWRRNGRISVAYRDGAGNEYVCVFKRD